MPASEMHNPTDTSPLTIERDAGERDAGTFTVLSGARLRCETCGTISDAAQQRADDAARTEGASDPADMTIVVHLVCPSCGTAGMLTLGYGPEADPDASDVIAAMPRDPRGPTSVVGATRGRDADHPDELSPGSDLVRDEPPAEPNEPG